MRTPSSPPPSRNSAISADAAKVAWVNATYLNEDTDWLNARALAERTALSVRLANEAARFDAVAGLSFDTRRKLDILKRMIVLPAPSTAGAAEELATLSTRLKSAYGKGKGTLGGEPIPGVDIEALMGTERDPERLKEMWRSWHAVGAPMRRDYVRLVEIANEGARELGFSDLGAMWRSNYDMDARRVRAADRHAVERGQAALRPAALLHARASSTRSTATRCSRRPARSAPTCSATCGRSSGATSTTSSRPRARATSATTSPTCSRRSGYDPIEMVKTGEGFFTSLGFAPLPETFWSARRS